MLPAAIFTAGDSSAPVSTTLLWTEHLELIVQTEASWPIDHRLQFTLILGDETAAGMAEVRAQRVIDGVHMMRCRIVRITPDNASALRCYQSRLDPAAAIAVFENSTTSATTARRGRLALNDALKDRVRRMRESRTSAS